MPCIPFTLPGGARGFVCTRSRQPAPKCSCGSKARFQCDADAGIRSGRCDRYLCGNCATELGPDLHVCPKHTAAKLPGAVQRQLEF
jgi:hypothetical protein